MRSTSRDKITPDRNLGPQTGLYRYVPSIGLGRSLLTFPEALRLLHKLGWVHRDLSSGNLMLGRGQLKIADFEYAKKMTEPRTEVHDIRTVGPIDSLLISTAQRSIGHGGFHVC